MRTLLSTLLVVTCSGLGWAADSDAQHIEVLNEYGLKPNAESLRDHLESIHPDKTGMDTIRKLIGDLGHPDFYKREAATNALLKFPVRSPELLRKAMEGPDLEIRWRAKQVLKLGNTQAEQLLTAIFGVISHRKIEGLARPVFRALPFCEQRYTRMAALKAMKASVRKADVEWLTREVPKADELQAVHLAWALEAAAGSDADDTIAALLKRPEEEVRLESARALLNHGNREALSELVALLDAESVNIRARTIQTLRSTTGERFQFVAYSKEAERAAAAEKWKTWLKDSAATAKLKTPLQEDRIQIGRTLICYYSSKTVLELDSAGKEVWKKTGVDGVWDCDGTLDGHRVLCSYSQKKIFEYDASGKLIWTIDNLPGRPFSVQRLETGNTLVTCYDNGRIIEYKRDKTTAWEYNIGSQPMDAQRLENGNTLVTLYQGKKVVEIDRAGKVRWELANLKQPRAAQRLENGNTLVTETSGSRVAEYDVGKKIVWSHTGVSNPLDAQRLPNGNTLISASKGVFEVDRKGKVVWQKNTANPSRVCRY